MLFDEIAGSLTFASLRSRAVRVDVAGHPARVASLEDIIHSKEQTGPPKDLAQLPMLRDALRITRELAAKRRP